MAATRLIGRTILATTAILGATLTPAATAATAEPAHPPTSFITLSVEDQSSKNGPRTSVLMCDPVGGTHPHAKEACAKLDQANGDFEELAGQNSNAMCTLDYRPVKVSAKGHWKDEQIDFNRTFSNDCMVSARTDKVFAF